MRCLYSVRPGLSRRTSEERTLQRTQQIESDCGRTVPQTEVLAGNDAVAALVSGWRARWRSAHGA